MKSQDASEFLRSLVYEIALLLPIHWSDFHSANTSDSSDKLSKEGAGNVGIPSLRGPEKRLTPQLSQLLHRMLRLFHHSLELVAARGTTEASSVDAAKQPPEQPQSTTQATAEPRSPAGGVARPAEKSPKLFELGLLHINNPERGVLDQVDVNAILSAAFVAAVYEQIEVVAPTDLSSSALSKKHQPMGPTVFWSGDIASHANTLATLRDDALGDEMYLQMNK